MKYLIILSVFFMLSGCISKGNERLLEIYQDPIKPQLYPMDSGMRELKQLWKTNLNSDADHGYAMLRPAYSKHAVFTVNREGTLYKIHASNGKKLWNIDLNGEVSSGVGLGKDIVTVSMDNGSIYAVSKTDGKFLWKTSIKRQISAIPVVGKSRVIVRTSDGLILGIDLVSGKVVWQIEKMKSPLTLHSNSSPVISGDLVFVGLSNGTLVAHNVISGREYWEVKIDSVRGQNDLEHLIDCGTPVIDGNTIYASVYQSGITSLQLVNARVNWKANISTRLPIVLSNEALFVINELGEIIALSKENGKILWKKTFLQGRGVTAPILILNRLIIGDADGWIHILNVNNGDLIKSKKSMFGSILEIVKRETEFIVLTSDGKLVSYSLEL